MKLLRIFGIGKKKILAKNCSVKGTVTSIADSWLHTKKKPVRLYNNASNTLYSHMITFVYQVDNIPYTGKLYVDLRYRCPQNGEQIDVYYDPEKPTKYACYPFGLGVLPIGW